MAAWQKTILLRLLLKKLPEIISVAISPTDMQRI
jgi:hypothetical protein